MRNLGRLLFATTCALWTVACASDHPRSDVQVLALPIIGGKPSLDRSGIAQISHAQGDRVCSGTLIAADLVVTAKHCVFRSSSLGDQPLAPAGFRVGFGADVQSFVWRGVSRVAWIGMPDELAVASAVTTGEDVAVLSLDQAAPHEETLHDMALDFVPANRQNVHIAGYGLTDVQKGTNGVRTFGSGQITGYDAATGIVQISGDSVCFGDSGGPVLSDDDARVLGVLGQVGGSGQNDFCDVGLSFAATAVNARVRRLLARECASAGGCGPGVTGREPAADLDAGMVAGNQASMTRSDAAASEGGRPDAARSGSAHARPDAGSATSRVVARRRASSGCSVMHRPSSTPTGVELAWLCVAAVLLRRRQRS